MTTHDQQNQPTLPLEQVEPATAITTSAEEAVRLAADSGGTMS
jgi:hypothetical protein